MVVDTVGEVFELSSSFCGVGALSLHLKELSAVPNRFQCHAQASLRRIARRRHCVAANRVTGSTRRAVTASSFASSPSQCSPRPTNESPQAQSRSSPKPQTTTAVSPQGTPARLTDVGKSGEIPSDELAAQQSLKKILSDPLMKCGRPVSVGMHPTTSLPLLELSEFSDWPSEVMSLLLPGDTTDECFLRTFVDQTEPATSGLRLHCGAFKIPHPRKTDAGGEDSFFISSCRSAAGVADGVGEWAWRFGLNPRAFADELMAGACTAAESTLSSGLSSLSSSDRAKHCLSEGFRHARSFGSSTALVVTLDGAELGVANIGDSGMRQIRHVRTSDGSFPGDIGARVVARSNVQQHSFNCPYQLASLPAPSDFPRLRKEKKFALVRAVQAAPLSKLDTPSDADSFQIPVQEGDLILLGTDGVFDNLHDREACSLIEHAVSPFDAAQTLDVMSGDLTGPRRSTNPSDLAEAIARAAFARASDPTARTPFSASAKESGVHCIGGKMDDITVVAAWVVRTAPNGSAAQI